jgi:hypothetical protein
MKAGTGSKGKIHPLAQVIMNLTPEQKDALATHLSQLPIHPPTPEMLNPALHYLQVMNAAKMAPALPTPPPATGAPAPGVPPAPPMAQPAPTVAPVAPTLTQTGQELGLADPNGIRQRNPYLNFGKA